MRALRAIYGPIAALLLRVTAAIAGRRAPVDGVPPVVRSVLVLRIDERVGNVLLTTPLIARLQEALPGARVDLLVARSKVDLVRGLVGVIPFEKKDLFQRPWRFLALLWRLRRARYDVAIDASHWHTFSTSSALLLAWTRAGIRIAHDRGSSPRWATDRVPLPATDLQESEIRTKLRLLEPLGIAPGSPRMLTALGKSAEAGAAIDAWLRAHGLLETPLVGLAPGGRKPAHRMAPEVFVALAAHARRLGARPIILWGPGEEDLAAELARTAEAELAPPTDLEGLAALMGRCRAIAVNDTGPMHLAVAVGTPTIALFTQPAEWRWGHAEPPHVVIAGANRARGDIVADARAAMERLLGEREVA